MSKQAFKKLKAEIVSKKNSNSKKEKAKKGKS